MAFKIPLRSSLPTHIHTTHAHIHTQRERGRGEEKWKREMRERFERSFTTIFDSRNSLK
jgi:hypothetical protein